MGRLPINLLNNTKHVHISADRFIYHIHGSYTSRDGFVLGTHEYAETFSAFHAAMERVMRPHPTSTWIDSAVGAILHVRELPVLNSWNLSPLYTCYLVDQPQPFADLKVPPATSPEFSLPFRVMRPAQSVITSVVRSMVFIGVGEGITDAHFKPLLQMHQRKYPGPSLSLSLFLQLSFSAAPSGRSI